jgi:hypothetical protein
LNEGVTTIPKGSTLKRVEARSILYKEKDGGQRRRALIDANSSILLHQNKNDLVGGKMKENFNYSDDHFNKLNEFINAIISEKEYYDFMFYLVIDLRLSIEDLVRIYNGSTFNDIKQILEQKFDIKFKRCNNCGQTKSVTSFSMKSKDTQYLSSFCKLCKAKKRKESLENNPMKKQQSIEDNRKYYWENKDKIQKHHKIYFKNNYDRIQEYWKLNNDKRKKHEKTYRAKNKERVQRRMNARRRERRLEDPKFRLNGAFAARIYSSLKFLKRGQHWEKIVGYTLDDLVKHLESKFDDKMSWNNYGSYWHVDHKVPIAAFDYTSYEDEAFKRCWSLENLQPLKNLDNLLKRDTISEEWNNVELAAQLL